uniref:acylaminoacyl-peptidase n=1 Tax=Periophthalmus magnuspinnatus TaxID=409849 RepID=A0A3B3Z8P8_9GOBI
RLRFCQRWTLVIEEKQNIQSVLPPGPAVPLNVWDERGLRKCLNLTALNKHGRIYDDAYFSCLSWSRCENKLLYIAEKKTESPNDGDYMTKTDRSVYREDWGEALSQKSSPVLCCVDLRTGTHSVLQGAPDQVSPGQVCAPSVFFVGWFHEPYRLGLNFCTNRRSALFRIDLEGNCERLSEENVSVLSPRLSPDGSALAFLQGKMFGPHAQLYCFHVFIIKHLICPEYIVGGFAGVYESLPSCCWSEDSQRIVFSSAHKNWKVRLNVCDGLRVFGSWRLLTIHRNLMVVCCSSPNTPPTLRVGFLPSGGHSVSWKTLQPPLCTFDFSWTVMDVRPSAEEDNAKYSNFLTVLLKNIEFYTMIIYFNGKLISFCFSVNYRGSTGFGQDSILSLIGQIGQQDVKDVQRAVQFALQTDATLDPERLAVFGGSHGGFLSCHLIGQFPDVYRACAVRNPVVNAATLLGTSDIIDCVGMHFSYEQIPTAEALATMLERSPITHAAKMKCALLLMLGGRDRRVSPHQGLELYRALKSRGRTVRLLWFPEDGHSLSRVDTQTDCFLNMVLWLQQHL